MMSKCEKVDCGKVQTLNIDTRPQFSIFNIMKNEIRELIKESDKEGRKEK